MDGARMIRLRWRMHGAWMWPSFIVLTLLDGYLIHLFPLAGTSESPVGAWLIAVVLSLIGIVAVAPLISVGVRRVRRDMPKVVARDYAGTAIVVAISGILVGFGLAHHAGVIASRRASEDATARAMAWIGDHAHAEFASNLRSANTYEMQSGREYRVCVTNRQGTRDYCVVVDRTKPFARSVKYSGSESNEFLTQGTW